MLSVGVLIRSDDSHPIFDVKTGKRTNLSKDVTIGKHVWLGQEAAILSGANIGDGCVVGFRSVVKGRYANNCAITGIPSRVSRKNIAWERPHLTLNKPFYKPDYKSIKKSNFWNKTDESIFKIKKVSIAISIKRYLIKLFSIK